MNNKVLEWRWSIPGELINSNEVHVWRVCLDFDALQCERLGENLSADELARARRFYFERDQKRYVVARGMLRYILSAYLEKKPHELRFAYTPQGKPLMVNDSGYDTLSFNVSHSDAFALYAVTRGRSVGIDIERIRDDVAIDQVSRKFFSEGEISSIEKTEENKRARVFFQYWTRKEAFLKATGMGLSFPMEQCDVSLMGGKVRSPLILPGDPAESPCWYGQDLFPGHGYAGAISVEGSDWQLSCRHYAV